MLGLALLFVYGVSSVLLAFITLLGEEGAGLCSYRPHNARDGASDLSVFIAYTKGISGTSTNARKCRFTWGWVLDDSRA